jgi:hypothetical protein
MPAKLYAHIHETSTDKLIVLLEFFAHPRVAKFYTGLLADLRKECTARGLCFCGGSNVPHVRVLTSAGSVSWEEHVQAWLRYHALNGDRASTAEDIAVRGGFAYEQLTELLGHRPTSWIADADR